MTTKKLLLLPGDGIGPEVMAEVKRVIAWLERTRRAKFEVEEDLVGGCAYDAHGEAISDAAMAKAKAADAVMLGAVGGPKWDKVPYAQRPEAGLLRLRKDLEPVRQSEARHLLSGADGSFEPQARGGRRPRSS